MPTTLSIVVPAYNESARIGLTIDAMRAFVASYDASCELIVVDDGSRDDTAARAASLLAGLPGARVISYRPNRGKGFAVRRGVAASTGDYVLFTDADLSTPMTELPRAMALLRSGNDIVVGSRAGGATVTRHQPLYRRIAARLFNLVRDGLVGNTGVIDSQCGFKLFRGPVGRDIFRRQRVDRFMFDSETLFIAGRLGYRVAEMPVAWADVPGSKVRVVRGALELVPELLSIRLRHGHLGPGDRAAIA